MFCLTAYFIIWYPNKPLLFPLTLEVFFIGLLSSPFFDELCNYKSDSLFWNSGTFFFSFFNMKVVKRQQWLNLSSGLFNYLWLFRYLENKVCLWLHIVLMLLQPIVTQRYFSLQLSNEKCTVPLPMCYMEKQFQTENLIFRLFDLLYLASIHSSRI